MTAPVIPSLCCLCGSRHDWRMHGLSTTLRERQVPSRSLLSRALRTEVDRTWRRAWVSEVLRRNLLESGGAT